MRQNLPIFLVVVDHVSVFPRPVVETRWECFSETFKRHVEVEGYADKLMRNLWGCLGKHKNNTNLHKSFLNRSEKNYAKINDTNIMLTHSIGGTE